jgi:hypothetical protein
MKNSSKLKLPVPYISYVGYVPKDEIVKNTNLGWNSRIKPS